MAFKPEVLVVDRNHESRQYLTDLLSKTCDCRVVAIENSHIASNLIDEREFHLIISELPENGFGFLERVKRVNPETPFIIISGEGDVQTAVRAIQKGAADFFEKPIDRVRLTRLVTDILSLNRKRHTVSQPNAFGALIGNSPAIRKVFQLISQVAEGESNITIIGESGTGKELVAREIHARSSRRKGSFVPVNCSAFPEHLFESELYGYEKGAFTGAYRRKPGLLEYAKGGTFFLDEICELSTTLQVKLLRALQDRKIRHIGGNELIDIDVRVISATNRDLQLALQTGALREDLYYRLNVIAIPLPPLRDRKSDIPPLCLHFLDKYIKQSAKEILGISPEAERYLCGYDWPGNVRELENVIERAIALTAGPEIEVSDLPEIVIRTPFSKQVKTDIPLRQAKQELVESFEKEYVIQMLRNHGGNVTRAAKSSGVDRRTFHRLLSRYEIQTKDIENL